VRALRAAIWRLRALFYRERLERELAEELEAHVHMEAEANLRAGMTAEDARRAALLHAGGIELAKEQYRDRRGVPFLETTAKDFRYAVRMLARNPAFAAVAILSLALGVGANTAIFSLTDAVLLRMLPVDKPEELELIGVMDGPAPMFSFSYPIFRELRRRDQAMSEIFARASVPASLIVARQTGRGVAEMVSGNYFRALGVQPAVGRLFTDDDDRVPLAAPVAVVSYRFWREQLGADPEAAGKQIHIDSFPFTVVGVAPAAFFGVEVGTVPDIWVPMMMQQRVFGSAPAFDNSNWGWLSVLGRRRPGMSEAQAQAGLNVAFQQVAREDRGKFWNHPSEIAICLEPGGKGLSRLRGRFENPLYVLMAVTAVVLLIACANLANLLLARATARSREIAVRLAMGAGRGRLIRQLLTESLVLALAGGAGGYVVSGWCVNLLLRFLPAEGNRPVAVHVAADVRLMGFTLLVSIGAALLFGLAPALRATSPELAGALKNDGSATRSRRFGLKSALAMVQVALSLLLLVGAGLFLRSLRNATAIAIGLKTENVVLATMNPRLSGYTPEQTAAFYSLLETELRGKAGVRAVGFSEAPWLSGAFNQVGMQVPGRPDPPGGRSILVAGVGGDFFDAVGIRILRGRGFGLQDTAGSVKVAVISQLAVRYFFGEQEPVGKTVRMGGQLVEIIGVAADSKYRSVREDMPRVGYLSQAQSPAAERTVYVRTAGNPVPMMAAVRSTVRGLDRSLPVYDVKTFAEQKSESLVRERLIATLTGFFGALAVLLAAMGLYGVMSYGVGQRTREIGIRMSLGADRGTVVRMVLRDCFAMVAAGIAIGLPLSAWLSRLVESELFGVRPNDPATVAGATLLLAGMGVLAGYVPARRASRVDPMRALRYE